MNSTEIIGVGLMCGTSQDGLDLAAVKFNTESYSFQFLAGQEVEIPVSLKTRLKKAMHFSALEYVKLDRDIGAFFGKETATFISQHNISPDFIASHGITIFHQPENRITSQIGSPAEICAYTKIKTIADFRSSDIALEGQGAPLVPGCDYLLYNQYDCTLNLGGFANVSLLKSHLKGYDITACNLALNFYAEKLHLPYDDSGKIAASGKIIPKLLEQLNEIPFFAKQDAKSLGKEWLDQEFLPIVKSYPEAEIKDVLRTITEHIATQIAAAIKGYKNCLVTGGGAHNHFLLSTLQSKTSCKIEVPSKETINFKEAICFAFLGLLRLQEKTNVFKSVTGAKTDNIGGCIYLPPTSHL